MLSVAAGMALAAASAGAEDAPSDGESVVPLGVVEVVGRSTEPLPPTADVLDIEQIREQGRRNVIEALDLLPGVTRQNFGQRRDSLVNVRGFDSRQVTLYIDGVPVYVPYDGNLDLARFGVEGLSRIVVTKGLTSVLYGPNALGGSINLVGARPQETLEGRAFAGFDVDRSGDVPDYRAGGRVATNQDTWYAQASASWQDADYYELPSGYPRSPVQPGSRRANSGSRDLDLSFKLGLTPNATDEYALSVYHVDDTKETPPYAGHAPGVAARYWRWPRWDKDGIYFLSRTRVLDSADLNLRLYHGSFRNELRSYDDASYTTQKRPYAFSSQYDDHTYGFSAAFEQRWSEAQITRLALHGKQDFHRETANAGSPWQHFKDRTWSAAAEHEWRPSPAWTITPGASWNLLQAQRAQDLRGGALVPFAVGSDVAFNGQVLAAWQAAEDWQLYMGAGRKTRFPTLKDRYSYRMGSAIPNPQLKPESSGNLEIGVQGARGALDYKLALFDSRLHDAIQAVTLEPVACTSPPCTQLRNVGRAQHRGIELSGGLGLSEDWSLRASYAWVQRRNLSQPGLRPTDMPRQKLFAAIDWRFAADWRATLSGDAESRRYTDSAGTRVAGGFAVVDAAVHGPLASLDFTAGVRNLLDRTYSYMEGFPEPGRTYFAEAGFGF